MCEVLNSSSYRKAFGGNHKTGSKTKHIHKDFGATKAEKKNWSPADNIHPTKTFLLTENYFSKERFCLTTVHAILSLIATHR